jgi:hypothetical protein
VVGADVLRNEHRGLPLARYRSHLFGGIRMIGILVIVVVVVLIIAVIKVVL